MTREEAINEIKSWDFLEGKEIEAIRTLIPELKESEDERIRKWIIEKVQGYADSGIPCSDEIQMANKALAYLEKQKEQKHYWKPTETDVALFNKAVTTNKALTPTERAQLDIIRLKFGFSRVERVKDQKPFNVCEQCPYYKDCPDYNEQNHTDNVSKEEYVKRFKSLCEAYEIKLPNREYDIYHLWDDLSKFFRL